MSGSLFVTYGRRRVPSAPPSSTTWKTLASACRPQRGSRAAHAAARLDRGEAENSFFRGVELEVRS